MTAEGASEDQGGPTAPSRRRLALIWLSITTAIGLLQFSYFYLAELTEGGAGSWLDPFISEMTATFGMGLLFLVILRWTRRFPLEGARVGRWLLAHAGGLVAVSLVHTSWMWASRSILFPLAGLGAYDYGIMPIRYFMEFPSQAIGYGVMVALITLYDRDRRARERALRVSHLEAQLAVAHLQNLRMQVQPHFLFNALNTVSSVMYQDVRQADKVLTALADLLRRTMRDSERVEVPLREEGEFLERYLEIMRARYGTRLDVDVTVPPNLAEVPVPTLCLQPLVENAIKHGDPGEGRPFRISVTAVREGARLVLEVRDNGPGPSGHTDDMLGRGIGLSNTAQRLETLYGSDQRLEVRRAKGGGALARVELPLGNALAVQSLEPVS